MIKKLITGLLLLVLAATILPSAPLQAEEFPEAGSKEWANTWTEVEYLGNAKYGASIYTGHQVFFDKADNNKAKKYKLTDDRATKDYILIQSAQVAVEIYPYYAKYYDVQHEDVRVEEERWVVQRLFKEPDTWRDVDSYNPTTILMTYDEPSGHVIEVYSFYDTDYGELTVNYVQREGQPLKHNVSFENTSGSTETFRVVQKWAGIVGSRVKHRVIVDEKDTGSATTIISSAEIIDSPTFKFLKDDGSLSVFENQRAMFYGEDGKELPDQNLKFVEINTHAQGMKADFVFGNWILSQNEVLEIDPDTATLDNPTEDNTADYKDFIKLGGTSIMFGAIKPTTTKYIQRGWVEWDVSGIADGSDVTDVVFKYEGLIHHASATNSDIKAIVNHQPSTHPNGSGAGQIKEVMDEIGSSAAYVSSNPGFPVDASNQSIDLGGTAETDLENQLGSDWFAIGFKTQESENPPNTTYWLHRIKSEEHGDVTPTPTLYVEYTLGIDSPTVTTQAASSIEDTTATGNGNITDTGGEDASAWGIVWNTTGNPDTGDNVVGGSGSGGTGAFTASLTSLPTGTTIHTKAYATNTADTSYGSEQDLLTKPAAPTSVSATDGSDSSKVVITWTKSTGASGYKVYEGANLLDTLGDVATYDDTAAPAGSIDNAGTPTASDGSSQSYVTLSLAGESTANGAARTYKVVALNATGDSDDSSTDTGYRDVGSITYQWQRSAADSDASYSNIGGGTTDPYNDTGAPAYPAVRWFRAVVSAVDASNSPQTSAGERGWKGPLAPTVTTQAASSVEETTATGNGNITDTGGENADERGVEWDTDSGAPYSYSATDGGSFGTGAFTKGMTGLDPGTTSYYRAKVHNSAGWSYGGEQTFYTKPGDPSGLGDTDRTATSIDLSWTKGSGAEKTMVRYRTDQYPTGPGDGTQAYFDVSNSTTVGGLSNGQIYYIRAWAWDTNSGYSDSYSQDTAYTLPGDPSSLTATTASDTQVDLTWSKGTGGDKTMVRRKTGSYPTDESDGSQVYFDTGNSTSDTGRDPDTLYFYRTWSYDTDSGYYSDGYSQDSTITYGPPSMTTDNATSVEESTLTWNGDLTATNGANAITRGFEWDIDSGAPYANTWTESGSFGTGAFTRSVVALAKGELWYYRAKATNTYGTGYGSEVTVLTKPDKPSSFSITAPEIGTQLDLTWDKGDGALNTYIRGKDGGYPTDRSDGYLVYNDTGESTSDTDLIGGHTYYYKAWSYATEGGKEQYSDLFDNAFGTPGLAPKLWIIWEYGATFTDLTGNDNDATPTFRTASSSANVSAVLLSFGPVSPSEIATYTLTDTYAVLSGNVTSSGGMYTDLDLSKLPAAPITEILIEAGVPAAAWWFPFLFLGICVIGLLTYGATTITRGPKGSLREGGIDGSLLTQFIVMEFALVVLGFMGPIPLWPSFLFPIAGVSLILSRKHLAWG